VESGRACQELASLLKELKQKANDAANAALRLDMHHTRQRQSTSQDREQEDPPGCRAEVKVGTVHAPARNDGARFGEGVVPEAGRTLPLSNDVGWSYVGIVEPQTCATTTTTTQLRGAQ